ncbi:low molecular weight protein arginine phosphatase [Bacillus benzoevorans]|uniref:Protein-tyrosine phosphatase n=1 Tax=Bacillus benzoevorans TaxID=1456 RepID=A0A7X0HRJ1_9BACI|nr:low molecular weight protein arginine phosphatase [Bacillus benzoevorans]MBB6445608.1 protein-tyrosine phosphatase [Bacillus benzoevorans]
MNHILFVCTGNTCRSAMAEAMLRNMNISGIEVKSAGVYAENGGNASVNAMKVLDEYQIPHNHQSTKLNEELIAWADYILTMTTGHKQALAGRFPRAIEKTFTLKEFAEMDGHADIADPYGGSVETYKKTFLQMKEAIEKIIPFLTEEEGGQ